MISRPHGGRRLNGDSLLFEPHCDTLLSCHTYKHMGRSQQSTHRSKKQYRGGRSHLSHLDRAARLKELARIEECEALNREIEYLDYQRSEDKKAKEDESNMMGPPKKVSWKKSLGRSLRRKILSFRRRGCPKSVSSTYIHIPPVDPNIDRDFASRRGFWGSISDKEKLEAYQEWDRRAAERRGDSK